MNFNRVLRAGSKFGFNANLPTPIHQWHLDESIGSSIVDSIGSSNGVVGPPGSDDTLGGPGVSGTGLIGMGAFGGFDVGLIPLSKVTGFTLNVWFRLEHDIPWGVGSVLVGNKSGGGGFDWILARRDDINPVSPYLEMQVFSNSNDFCQYTAAPGAVLGGWNLATIQYDPVTSHMRTLLNGSVIADGTFADDLSNPSYSMFIRNETSSGNSVSFYPIDEVSIYDRALTTSEVLSIYNAQSKPAPLSPPAPTNWTAATTDLGANPSLWPVMSQDGVYQITSMSSLASILRSVDSGQNFTTYSAPIATTRGNVAISNDGQKILLMSPSPGVIYPRISIDGGASWNAGSQTGAWRGAYMAPDGSYMLAFRGTTTPGIYKSTDGLTWTLVQSVATGTISYIKGSSDGVNLIAGLRSASPFEVYRSTDSGDTWTSDAGAMRTAMVAAGYAGAGNGVIYSTSSDLSKMVAFGTSTHPAISTDSGASWTLITAVPVCAFNIGTAISGDGAKMHVLGGSGSTMDLYYSTDTGATWAPQIITNNSRTFFYGSAISLDGKKQTTSVTTYGAINGVYTYNIP
jgi:hypothetical protein